LLQSLFRVFASQQIYGYAFVAKSLQLRVSLRAFAPRYGSYRKIWVKDRLPFSVSGSGKSQAEFNP
jgi:hypothetical protein